MNAENVGAILDALGARFGATGAHLWLVLQRQAYVEFYSAIGVLFFGLLVLAIAWVFDDGSDRATPIWIIGVFITGGGLFAAAVTATGVANPEYYALHKVLLALK